ncbi:hypothetical protein Syun_019385 [Stephania yunnanensis]|uniref:Uncharacterized protein n=1 Tax=Stephania yunnanensis TaxID=152371 RepID=A0AAP0IU22_9MAGN
MIATAVLKEVGVVMAAVCGGGTGHRWAAVTGLDHQYLSCMYNPCKACIYIRPLELDNAYVIEGVKVVANILSKGTKLREYAKGVENDVRQVELDSIQPCLMLYVNLFPCTIIQDIVVSITLVCTTDGLKPTIPTEFARDIVPLSETISLKLVGDRTWTVGIREEKDRLVLEDEWEDFYDHEDKVHAESLVFIDGAPMIASQRHN